MPAAPSVAYGDHPHAVANLHLPSREGGPWPCVVLVHGGFWRSGWDRTLMTPLAHDLARRGVAAWNIEFRRVGQEGGGWPGTFHDVAAAVDHLAKVEQVDTARVATCGHSAGGHLALWLAANRGARAAIALGSVCDLAAAEREQLGRRAVRELFGEEAYDDADPAQLLPLGIRQVLVHGVHDDRVPIEHARNYAERARAAGDECVLLELDAGHFDVVDPRGPCFMRIVEALTLVSGSAEGGA